MPPEIQRGAFTLCLEGPDLVMRQRSLLKSKEERLPLRAISSINIERERKLALILASVAFGVFGLAALGSDASVGIFLLLVAGASAWLFFATRTVTLVALSPTGTIRFQASGPMRMQLEAFLASAQQARAAPA